MKRGNWKKWGYLLVLLLLLVAIGGCSTEKTAQEEDMLIVSTANDTGEFNPHTYTGPMYAQEFVYEGLTNFMDGKVVPGLAESWDVSADGREYVFHLRKGVTFSDGTPFNAAIAKKNLDAVLAHKDVHAWIETLHQMQEVVVVDDHTLKIKFANDYYPVLQELSLPRPMRFLAAAGFSADGDTGKKIVKPIGTGMWVVKEYKAGEYTILERNEKYWGEKPKFKYLKMVVMADGNTAVNALKAGEIDLIYDIDGLLTADAFKELQNSGFTTMISEPMDTTVIALNSARPFTKELKVRQAISYATDKKTICDHVYYGLQKPAETLFDPNLPYCNVGLKPYGYDQERAKQLLEQAGWKLAQGKPYREKNGQQLCLKFYYDTESTIAKVLGQVLQNQYAKVGIKIDLIGEESSSYGERQKDGSFDMMITNTWGNQFDPHSLVASMREPTHADYSAQKGLPMKVLLDQKITDVLVERDENKRKERYRDILTTLHDQAVYVPLSFCTKLIACKSEIKGAVFNTAYDLPLQSVYRER